MTSKAFIFSVVVLACLNLASASKYWGVRLAGMADREEELSLHIQLPFETFFMQLEVWTQISVSHIRRRFRFMDYGV